MDSIPGFESCSSITQVKQEIPVKRTKTVRRHGACNPCKASKTKCDGAEPCGACRNERRRSRTCEYSDKAKGIAAAREEATTNRPSRDNRPDDDSDTTDLQEHHYRDHIFVHATPSPPAASRYRKEHSSDPYYMYRRISLYQVLDEFIQVKAIRGQALQDVRRVQKKWEAVQKLIRKDMLKMPEPLPSADAETRSGADPLHQDEASYMLTRWQSCLEQILGLVNEGDLTGARNLVPLLIRSIESYEVVTNHTYHPSGYAERVRALCLRLIELDCLLGFFLGGELLLSAWTNSKFLLPKIEQAQTEDIHLSSKIQLFTQVEVLMSFDTSSKQGVWELLHHIKHIKQANPATVLEKIATSTTKRDPIEAQRMKLVANLVFIVIYCRTASVCGYYSQDGCILPSKNGSASDIITDLRLSYPRQKSSECSQVIKHAGNVLEAFESLCEMDQLVTATCWFRLHGALIASVLIAISGLREKSYEWKLVKERLVKVEQQFQDLKRFNPDSAIIKEAITILQECEQRRSKPAPSINETLNLLRHSSESASDKEGPEPISHMTPTHSDKRKPGSNRKRNVDEMLGETTLKKSIRPVKFNRSRARNLSSDVPISNENRSNDSASTALNVSHSHFNRGLNDDTGFDELMVQTSFASNTSSFTKDMTPHAEVSLDSDRMTYPQPGPPFRFPFEGETFWHPPIMHPCDPNSDPNNDYYPYRLVSLQDPHDIVMSMGNPQPPSYDDETSQSQHDIQVNGNATGLQPTSGGPAFFNNAMSTMNVSQYPVVDVPQGSNFFNLSTRHFEPSQGTEFTDTNTQLRPNLCYRRLSEQGLITTRTSTLPSQAWHDSRRPSVTDIQGQTTTWLPTNPYDWGKQGCHQHAPDQQRQAHDVFGQAINPGGYQVQSSHLQNHYNYTTDVSTSF